MYVVKILYVFMADVRLRIETEEHQPESPSENSGSG